jgi:hypothetical protein
MAIDFMFTILITHLSIASTTTYFLPSITLFVLPVGLSPLFEVETDSDSGVVMVVTVGAVIAVTFTVAKAMGEASVKPDTTF